MTSASATRVTARLRLHRIHRRAAPRPRLGRRPEGAARISSTLRESRTTVQRQVAALQRRRRIISACAASPPTRPRRPQRRDDELDLRRARGARSSTSTVAPRARGVVGAGRAMTRTPRRRCDAGWPTVARGARPPRLRRRGRGDEAAEQPQARPRGVVAAAAVARARRPRRRARASPCAGRRSASRPTAARGRVGASAQRAPPSRIASRGALAASSARRIHGGALVARERGAYAERRHCSRRTRRAAAPDRRRARAPAAAAMTHSS